MCIFHFFQISLMPDDEKRTQCKTELVAHSNQPIFNKTFTL